MAIVFCLENPTFLAKSKIWIPKCTEGGGSTGLENIPKKYQFLFTASLNNDVCELDYIARSAFSIFQQPFNNHFTVKSKKWFRGNIQLQVWKTASKYLEYVWKRCHQKCLGVTVEFLGYFLSRLFHFIHVSLPKFVKWLWLVVGQTHRGKRRRRRTTNSLHQLSPEFSFSRPVMETTPSQQGKSWASIIARMIWSTFNCSRTTLLGAQYIIAEQDSGPPTPSQCNQFCPLSIASTNDRKWTIWGLLHRIQESLNWQE